MTHDPTLAATARIAELVRILNTAERELQALTGGQIDAVVGGGGGAYLLQEAQERLRRTEEAQRTLAATQAAILDALPAHVALIDATGVIRVVNAAWRRFAEANALGMPDSAIGQNYLAVCAQATGADSAEAQPAADGIGRVLGRQARDFSLEYPCHAPHEQRWFRLMVSPLRAAGVSGAVVMHVDITERKLAELALHASERRFASAFEHAAVGVALILPDATLSAVNAAFCQMLGYQERELAGKTVSDITHPADLAADLSYMEQVLDGRLRTYQMEKRYVRKDGALIWGLKSVSLVRDETGQPLHFISQIQDLTEQRRALQEVRTQAQMLDQIGQAVIATDLDGRVTYANREAGEVYGWSPKEMVGQPVFDITVPQATQAQAESIMSRLRQGHAWRGEFQVRHRSGRVFTAEVTNSPVVDHDGTIVGIIGVSVDISARKQAEAAAAHLAAIVESSDDAIIGMDVNGVITSWNRGAERIFGYASAEMVGQTIRQLLPADVQSEPNFILDRIRRGQSVDRFETRRLTRDGRVIDVSITASPIRDASGAVVGVAKLARDITEAKQAEAELIASEARLAAAQALARLGSWELNLATLSATASAEMNRLHYRDPQAGMPTVDEIRALVHPDDRGVLDDVLAHISDAPGPFAIEYRTHPDRGPVRHLAATIHVIRDAGGRSVGVAGTAMDVTDRKTAEERRRRTETRFRRLVESNAQGVMLFSTAGAITDANDALLTLLGYSRDDLAAGQLRWTALTPLEYAALDQQAMRELATLRVAKAYEKEFVRRDGSRVPVLMGAAVFDDQPDEGVAFIVDLTERKKLEKQFLRAQRMESIGTLAGGIAHDLNNVLAPIMMSVEMLRELNPSEEAQTILTTLEASALRGADLVRQVLSFARGVEGARVPVRMAPVLRDLLKVVRDTFPKSIDVHLELPPDLATVIGDATQIHQVLLNLCVNARDAMPHGGRIVLSLQNVVLDDTYAAMNPSAQPGAYVMIQVADTGSGIPPQLRDKVFEPFFTTKEIGKGTGLGLSTTLAIVKSHGGFISLYSEVGRGTRFKVYLPADLATSSAGTVPEPGTLPRGQGELVLVVDDEDAVREIARLTLERYGYRVVCASNGAEAVALYVRHQAEVAVVLTDMAMPIMDGPALIQALRAINPSVRIIGSSGLASNGGLTRALGAGVPQFVTKPYSAHQLLTTLRAALSDAGPG